MVINMEYMTDMLQKEFGLKRLPMAEASSMKVGPMKFDISHYWAAGAGHLSVMRGSAMLGLMKMDTVIFAPTEKDAPLLSYDRIKAMGNDTFLVELYDTLLDGKLAAAYEGLKAVCAGLEDIPDHDLGKHWYDYMKMPASIAKKAKKRSKDFDRSYEQYVGKYIELLKAAPGCDEKAKKAKTGEYVTGLFENGGPSTDAFINGIGRKAAEELFRKVIFGVE